MRAANQINVVSLSKLTHLRLTEGPRHAAVVLTKFFNATFRVRPEQITEQALLRYVSRSHDVLYLVHALELRREPAMHAKDLLVNEGTGRQAVEYVREDFPESN